MLSIIRSTNHAGSSFGARVYRLLHADRQLVKRALVRGIDPIARVAATA
jgi:hypothetical protein